MNVDFLVETDRKIEFALNNIRGGVEDFLWVKKRTAELLTIGWASFVDLLVFSDLPLLMKITSSLPATFINYGIVKYLISKPDSRIVEGINPMKEKSASDRLIICYLLQTVLIYLLQTSTLGYATALYLLINIHDDDDRGIKNWAKWQLKRLRGSIKIPGLQPSPA